IVYDSPGVIERLRSRGRESVRESVFHVDEPIHASTPDPVETALDLAPKVSLIQHITSDPVVLSSSELLCIVWATGTALWLAIAAFRIARFRKLLSKTRPAKATLQAEVEQLAAEFGLRRSPEARIANGTVPPLTWALWGRPVILLPRKLLE